MFAADTQGSIETVAAAVSFKSEKSRLTESRLTPTPFVHVFVFLPPPTHPINPFYCVIWVLVFLGFIISPQVFYSSDIHHDWKIQPGRLCFQMTASFVCCCFLVFFSLTWDPDMIHFSSRHVVKSWVGLCSVSNVRWFTAALYFSFDHVFVSSSQISVVWRGVCVVEWGRRCRRRSWRWGNHRRAEQVTAFHSVYNSFVLHAENSISLITSVTIVLFSNAFLNR